MKAIILEIEKEILEKAGAVRPYAKINQDKIDVTFGILIQMKAQVDGFVKNQQKTPQELAILYKRFVYNSGDLLQNLSDGVYENSNASRKGKVAILRKQNIVAEGKIKEMD